MKKGETKELTLSGKVLLLLLCIVLNLTGRLLADRLQLPLWLDTVGISMAVCLVGAGGALLVSIFSGFLLLLGNVSCEVYFLIGILLPVFQKIYMRIAMPNKLFKVLKLGFLSGLLSVFVTVPVYLFLSGGRSTHFWGDALYCMLEWHGAPPVVCSIAGAVLVEIVDKQVSLLIAFGFIALINRLRKASENVTSKRAAVLVLCLLINNWGMVGITAEASEATEKYVSTIYNNSSGLYSSEANAIAETEDGCIWIGSYAGLTRYDGKKFEFITEGGIVSVTALMTDSKGNLWIGTNSGRVVLYQGEEFHSLAVTSGEKIDSIRCFEEMEDGTIYVGTTGKMCKIGSDNTLQVLEADVNYVISMTQYEGWLVGCTNQGDLFVMEEDKVVQVYSNENPEAYYTCVGVANERIMAGTSLDEIEELCIIDNRIWVADRWNIAPLFGIQEITKDSTGKIWLAAENGLGYLDGSKLHMVPVKEFESSIESVHEDYEGNIWLASSRYGVLKLSKSVFGDLFSEGGIEETVVNAVCQYEGAYYCACDDGLVVIDEASGKSVSNELTELLQETRIRSLMVDSKNNLWLASYSDKGLVRYSAEGGITTFTQNKNGATSDRFRCLEELADGTIVAGTSNGVNLIKGDKIIGTLTQEDGLENAQILCIQEKNDGSFYVGSDGAGIYTIKEGKIIGHVGEEEGLSSAVVMRITPYQDGFFVVSGDSLCYMVEDQVTTLKNFPYYNNYDVIVHGEYVCVLASAGIYFMEAGPLAAGEEISYKLYNYYDGLMDGLTANSWNYVDEADTLYFCTNAGVNYFNPSKLITNTVEYKFGLSSVMYDGIEVKAVDGVYYIPEDVKTITLEGSLRNYLCTNVKLRFFVKELNADPQTVSHTELEALQISNLKHGKYTICMQVMNDDESMVMQEQCYTLIKEAHTWEEGWYQAYVIAVGAWIVLFLVCMFIDIRISAERDKELEKIKYQAKGEFLTNMSHEFRTPVNTILGMNEMIMQESPDERIAECSENIKQASARLLTLINDVLDFSAIEAGKLEIITERYFLEDILNSVIGYMQDAASKKGIATEYNIDDNLPAKLWGDEGRVKQIIMNIMSNAVKYTERGQIIFTVGGRVEKDIFHLTVTVADTGIGISEENVEKIFAEFDRLEFDKDRRIEGTGLGLSIANSLVKQMGGNITLQSVEGSGSIFTVTIPQKIEGKKKIGIYTYIQESENEQVVMNLVAPEARVLAVDDNRMNLSVISGLLKRHGILPDVAFGGEEALELCEQNKYDLVLMDHMMPYPDGIETLHRIREKEGLNQATPMVVLTANAVSGARKRYMEEGFDDYLSKPVDVKRLEAVLLRFLPMERVVEQTGEAPGHSNSSSKQGIASGELISREIGLRYCGGSEDLYAEILASYYTESARYEILLTDYYTKRNWKDYAIVAHALKSTSLGIGASSLSELAKKQELAAKAGDVSTLATYHEELLALLARVLEEIKASTEVVVEKEPTSREVEKVELSVYVDKLKALLEYVVNYEMVMALECLEQVRKHMQVEGIEAETILEKVESAINEFDYGEAEELLTELIKTCEEKNT